jgi:hypothetical protein
MMVSEHGEDMPEEYPSRRTIRHPHKIRWAHFRSTSPAQRRRMARPKNRPPITKRISGGDGPRFELYYNDPEDGWSDIELRERIDSDSFPNVSFEDPRVKLGDMTGDGLQDIILVHNGRLEYWPYRGFGRWSRRVIMRNSPRFEDAAFSPIWIAVARTPPHERAEDSRGGAGLLRDRHRSLRQKHRRRNPGCLQQGSGHSLTGSRLSGGYSFKVRLVTVTCWLDAVRKA